MLAKGLSKPARIVLAIMAGLTIVVLAYLHSLNMGPTYFLAGVMAKFMNGRYSVGVVLLFSAIPFLAVEAILIRLIDKACRR
jgi:hypothetical protein